MNAKLLAFLSALFFAASTPLAKILLGVVDPIVLAGLLYLGSGSSLLIFKIFKRNTDKEAQIRKADLPWLLGAIISGGVLAPIVLLFSIQSTPAATASLLLNFETVSTTLIAALFFKEAIGKRIWLAIFLITGAGVILTLNLTSSWGVSLGAIGIIIGCVLWGADNNFTRHISAKDPLTIVIAKGLIGGTFSLFLAYLLQKPFPTGVLTLYSLILGVVSYGFSLLFFIRALRELGAARTSALFGTAPFVGAILSFLIFNEIPGVQFLLSLPLMVAGAYLILNEKHAHDHVHELLSHEHKHKHEDGHHTHSHEWAMISEHSHIHTHTPMKHAHSHTPDIHHKHSH